MFPETTLQWETTLLHTGVIFQIISFFTYVARALVPQNKWLREGAWLTLLFSVLTLAASLWFRSINAEYFALSNMFESLLVVIMLMQVAFLVLDRVYQIPGMGWVAGVMLLGTLAFDLTLPTDIKPLQAALQSYWRAIHVPVILASYSLFTLSFVSSIVYTVLALKADRMVTAIGGSGSGTMGSSSTGSLGNRTPSLELYDEVTYRCISLGIPLLTIGIILGGLWANEAWGNYWSWDPKESMSLVTLLGYGVYLHMRVNGGHSAKTLSYVAIGAFALLLLTYFGVNLMGVGLHSYGKIG